MAKDNKGLFVVTYRDNKNSTHMVFVNRFKSVKNLENQYGKVTIENLNKSMMVSFK